jgi:hypothetical protein
MGIAVLVAGLALAVLFMIDRNWARILATALTVFLAAAALGAFGGFLFGLPRDAPVAPDAKPVLRFVFNSNLLKVSDWLTTIIVGLTLVNLRSVGPTIAELGDALADPLGGYDQSAAFGVAITVFGFAGSAILMYLWTTVRLRQHLERSEMALAREAQTMSARSKMEDFLQGRAEEDDLRSALATLEDDDLRSVQADLDKMTDAESRERREAAGGIITDVLSKRSGPLSG